MAAYCVSLLFLAILSAEDIREKELSVCKVMFFAFAALIFRMITGQLIWNEIKVCLMPGIILLLIAFLTNESIGYGDGMSVLVLGLWTGGRFTMAVVCIGIMLSGVWGAVCLLKKKKEPIPFLPFLLLGMEVALIYA